MKNASKPKLQFNRLLVFDEDSELFFYLLNRLKISPNLIDIIWISQLSASALECIDEHKAILALVRLKPHDLNGLSFARLIASHRAQTSVFIALDLAALDPHGRATMHGTCPFLFLPWKAGDLSLIAEALIHKKTMPNLDAEKDTITTKHSAQNDLVRANSLTPRELCALTHLAKCLKHKEIAHELGVSHALEKKIVRQLYAKLSVDGRLGAILLWNSMKQHSELHFKEAEKIN